MESTITATELSRRLSDVLNRVKYRGERFVIERNGEVVATIGPVNRQPGITVRDFVAQIGDLKMPGDGFADDLEAIQAAQGLAYESLAKPGLNQREFAAKLAELPPLDDDFKADVEAEWAGLLLEELSDSPDESTPVP